MWSPSWSNSLYPELLDSYTRQEESTARTSKTNGLASARNSTCLPKVATERSRVTLPQKAVKTTEEASLGSHVTRPQTQAFRLSHSLLAGKAFEGGSFLKIQSLGLVSRYPGRINRHHPVPHQVVSTQTQL